MKAVTDMQETRKTKQIRAMKKLFFWSLGLLFVSEYIGIHWITMIFALGLWWGGLGWLWQKFKFRRADDL